MQDRQTERRQIRIIVGLTLGAALLLAWGAAVQQTRSWRVESALKRFQAAPNGEHAHELIRMIADQAVTRKQGERILTVLLRPEITTRPAYPAGKPAKMSVGRSLHIEMPKGWIDFEQQVWAGGQQIDAGNESTNRLFSFPEILNAWVEPLELGTYHAELRTACRTRHPGRNLTLWDRLHARVRSFLTGRSLLPTRTAGEPSYECRFIVPFDVNIVEPDRAERLELVADPQIDEAVRVAIATKTSDRHGSYTTAAGRLGYHGSMDITIKRLPIAVAFQLSLRLPDGRMLPSSGADRAPQHIRLRSGDHAQCVVDVGCFGIEEPGEYTGTLILQPDPDYAYEDATIKAIWDGTLEFPISFTVYVKTQAQ